MDPPSWTLILSFRVFFKLLVTREVLAYRLISFIETPGPPPLGCHWHVRPAVTQARLSLIPSLQEGVPTSLPKQLITQKLWNEGLGGARRRMRRRWTGWNRGVHVDTVPPLLPLPHSRWPTSNLSTFRYIDLARTTGSQQVQNKALAFRTIPRKSPRRLNSSPSLSNNNQSWTQQNGWLMCCSFKILSATVKSLGRFCCHLRFQHFASVPRSWKQHKEDSIFWGCLVKPKTVINIIIPDFCHPQNIDSIIAHDDAED